MTTVCIKRHEESIDISVEEHTESIVCAGISALVYAIAGWADNHSGKNIIHLDDGDAQIHLKRDPETDTAVDLFDIGIRQIQLGYPNDIIVIA